MIINLQDGGVIISVGGAILSVISGFVYLVVKIGRMIERVDILWKKQDVMWDYLVDRGKVATVRRSWAQALDDEGGVRIKVSPRAKALIPDPLRIKLIETFSSRCHQMQSNALLLEIQEKFGKELVKELCIPYLMHEGECLVIAEAVVRAAAD